MNGSLKYKLLKDFLPAYIELNGLRIPFRLFEACQVYKAVYDIYIEEIIINKCKNYMITEDKNENRAPYIITTTSRNAFDLLKSVSSGGAELVKTNIEKLLYQLNKYQITKWNISTLDQLVHDTKLNQDYGEFLHKSKQYRKLHIATHVLEDGVSEHSVNMLKEFELDQNETIQIYGINIKMQEFDRDEEQEETTIESVYYYNINNEFQKEKVFLWMQNENDYVTSITSDERNIGLAHFNYLLLHNWESNIDSIPSLKIVCNTDCNIAIRLEYTKLNETDNNNQHEKVFEEMVGDNDNEEMSDEKKKILLLIAGYGRGLWNPPSLIIEIIMEFYA